MKPKEHNRNWKFLPVGDNSIKQYVLTEDEKRNKFTENPSDPASELDIFVTGKKSFSLLFIPPCSEETFKAAKSYYEKVIIVDYNQDRIKQFNCAEDEKLLIIDEEDFRKKLYEFSEYLEFGKALSYIPQRYRKLDPKLCSLLELVLIQTQKELCSFAVNRSLKRWHRNLNAIKNLQNINESISTLPNLNKADVLIVGAGPSLDDTVSKIKIFKDRFYIVATDGSLKTLLRNDVIPDLIVSCEDSLLSWQFFTGSLDRLKNVVLAAPYMANHYLLENYMGPICLTKGINSEGWASSILKDIPLVEQGRCVGHYAFNFAIALNAGRIIMTGFDLAFKGEVFHPKDMPVPYFHDMYQYVSSWVESINGDLIKTDLSMHAYLRDFEYMISKANLEVIDATEGGALKKGTEIKNLDEIKYFNKKVPLSLINTKRKFKEVLIDQYKNSKSFKETLQSSFTAYLVQKSNEIESRQKLEDINSSKKLCKQLMEVADNKKASKPLLLAPSLEQAEEIRLLFGLPEIECSNKSSLSELIEEVRELGVEHIYCVDGEVPPDLLSLEKLKCTDLKLKAEMDSKDRNLWIGDYNCLCTEESYSFWRGIIPKEISVKRQLGTQAVKKVS